MTNTSRGEWNKLKFLTTTSSWTKDSANAEADTQVVPLQFQRTKKKKKKHDTEQTEEPSDVSV